MTASLAAGDNPRPRNQSTRRDWPTAFRAVRRLLANKEDTAQFFVLVRALNGDAYMRDYARLLSTDDGGRIAYERVELTERLLDDAWCATFPPGSVGAAYRDYLRTEHLSAQGLLDESHKGIPPAELDAHHPYMWFFRRIRDIHDVWHVLTGYGRDALGELCLVQLSFQETHGLGWALMTLAGYLRAHGPAASQARKAILEARRRGKHVAWLPAEDYERLLFEPLDAAQRRLRLTPPLAYEAVPPAQRNLVVAM